MLEDLFNPFWITKRPYLAFFFGFLFSFIGFIVAWFFFKSSLSVSMVFLTALLLIPSMIRLIVTEEKLEGKFGMKHFFRNHKAIFEAYFFSFIGVFSAFLILGFAAYGSDLYGSIFSFQSSLLNFQGVDSALLKSFVESSQGYGFSQFLSLLSHNLIVLFVCFILSFFYGASAIFLIILNGSVFASFIIFVVKNISENLYLGLQAIGFFMLHLLPEISGFLIAAIAGGVVSKAVLLERKDSKRFKNVFKDAFIMMIIATALIIIGALLETFVTSALFRSSF